MAHFAHITNGIVDQVIVAEQDFIDSGLVGPASEWVQTSYNTRGGVHYQADGNTPSADQSKALRKNFAGVGYTYDTARDAFIAPKPFASWVLDEASCLWNAPVAMPTDGKPYEWDEATTSWKEVQLQAA